MAIVAVERYTKIENALSNWLSSPSPREEARTQSPLATMDVERSLEDSGFDGLGLRSDGCGMPGLPGCPSRTDRSTGGSFDVAVTQACRSQHTGQEDREEDRRRR